MNEILPKKPKNWIVLVAICLNIFLKDINTVSYHLWTCPQRDTSWSGSAGTGFGSCAWWHTFHSLRTSCNGYSAECCVWRNPGEGTRRIKSLKGVFCGNVSVYWTQRRNTVFVWVSPCSLHRRARHNGTQMRCPRIPYTEAPYLQSLWQRHTCIISIVIIISTEKCKNKVLAGKHRE